MTQAGFAEWKEAARPHTFGNAFAPVIAGSGVAAWDGSFHLVRALLAGLVAWALIIGTNFANDYSDGIRGTDEDRTGPLRITASGLAEPKTVKRAAFACFGIAGIFGLILVGLADAWWMVLVGIACVLAAWFYTGGKHPYGYMGLGEVFVFIFFGLVAVMGTEYTQSGVVSIPGVAAAVGLGSISAGVNLANNIRDIHTDAASGKRTLAVKLGEVWARRLFLTLITMPFVATVVIAFYQPWVLCAFIVAPLVWKASYPVRSGATGRELIPVLGDSGKAMIAWAVVVAVALSIPEIIQ